MCKECRAVPALSMSEVSRAWAGIEQRREREIVRSREILSRRVKRVRAVAIFPQNQACRRGKLTVEAMWKDDRDYLTRGVEDIEVHEGEDLEPGDADVYAALHDQQWEVPDVAHPELTNVTRQIEEAAQKIRDQLKAWTDGLLKHMDLNVECVVWEAREGCRIARAFDDGFTQSTLTVRNMDGTKGYDWPKHRLWEPSCDDETAESSAGNQREAQPNKRQRSLEDNKGAHSPSASSSTGESRGAKRGAVVRSKTSSFGESLILEMRHGTFDCTAMPPPLPRVNRRRMAQSKEIVIFCGFYRIGRDTLEPFS